MVFEPIEPEFVFEHGDVRDEYEQLDDEDRELVDKMLAAAGQPQRERRPATTDELVGMLSKRDRRERDGNTEEVARLDRKIETHLRVRAE